MNQTIKCGTFRVAENKTYHYAGFECAAWWEDIAVAAGEYPVHAIVEQGRVRWFRVSLPGVIVEDFFPSLWVGTLVGKPYDYKRNAGKEASYHIQCHDYSVFDSIAHNVDSQWSINLSLLPNIGTCLNPTCGSAVTIYKDARFCPSCSVKREKEALKVIEKRHSFLLDAAYLIRTTEAAAILDRTIYHYFEDGKRGYHRDQLMKTIAGLRKAGPEGRKAARERYSPRVRRDA